MFSNVNNGLPKKRCFEDMMAEADNILEMFHGSAIASLSFIVLYLLTSAIVLLYRVYASCSWCFKKKDQTGKKYEEKEEKPNVIGHPNFEIELEEQG